MGALASLAAEAFCRHQDIDDSTAILAESARAMMIVNIDSDKIIHANAAAYELFGPTLAGDTLSHIVPERPPQAFSEHRCEHARRDLMRARIDGDSVTSCSRVEVLAAIAFTSIPTTRLGIVEIDPLEDRAGSKPGHAIHQPK